MLRTLARFSSTTSITAFTLALTLAACSPDETKASTGTGPHGDAGIDAETPPAGRGRLVSAQLQSTITRAQLEELREKSGLTTVPAPKFDVACSTIRYETIDLYDAPVEASGLACVPLGVAGPRPLLSYQHGTTTADSQVPSGEAGAGIFLAFLYAASGYVVSAADYLGLGAAPGFHPYLHAASEATASIDMIRATRQHARDSGVELGSQLFLAGYSQGGHATMALHRALEAGHAAELPVTAAMPMAGSYDMSQTTIEAVFATPAPSTPTYLAYALLAYDMVYDVYPSPEVAFAEPAKVGSLFDRKRTFDEIAKEMPTTPEAVLRPEFLNAFRTDPNHSFRAALRANDVYDWKPRAPVRLCHGGADRDVTFQNSVVAHDRMKALGADVELVAVGAELDHDTAGIPCEVAARAYFDALVPGDTP